MKKRDCFYSWNIRPFLTLFFLIVFAGPQVGASLNCQDLFSTRPSSQALRPAATQESNQRWVVRQDVPSYGGQLIDSKKFLPVEGLKFLDDDPLLSSEEKALGVRVASFENFLHNQQFFSAKIKIGPGMIQSMMVQLQPFSLGGVAESGHVQARFVMSPENPIVLTRGDVTVTVPDMIVSYEAALPVGEIYNAPRFVLDRVPLVGRVVSADQKYSEGTDRLTRQFYINYREEEKSFLLEYFLRDSHKIAMSEFYRTHSNNCAIRIFDVLDLLMIKFRERFRNMEPKPFQLVLGPDSISGPTINAVVERTQNVLGLEAVEIQDMRDEYTGVTSLGEISGGVALQPVDIHGDLKLILVRPDLSHLNDEQKAVVQSVLKDIEFALPGASHDLLAAVTAAVASEGAAKLISENKAESSAHLGLAAESLSHSLLQLTQRLKARIDSVAHLLPDTPIGFHFLLADHPEVGALQLGKKENRLGLPIAVIEKVLPHGSTHLQKSVLRPILKGVQATTQAAAPDAPAFVKGVMLSFSMKRHAEKSDEADIQAHVQVVLGLPAQSREVSIRNDQVLLDNMEMPDPPSLWQKLYRKLTGSPMQDRAVTTVLTVSQVSDSESPDIRVQVGFGRNKHLGLSEDEQGLLSLSLPELGSNPWHCWSGWAQPHGPTLTGSLGSAAMGQSTLRERLASRFLKGKKVRLSITDIDSSLRQMQIRSVRVRVGFLGLRCIELDSVNSQFAQQAQQMLQEMLPQLDQLEPMENMVDSFVP